MLAVILRWQIIIWLKPNSYLLSMKMLYAPTSVNRYALWEKKLSIEFCMWVLAYMYFLLSNPLTDPFRNLIIFNNIFAQCNAVRLSNKTRCCSLSICFTNRNNRSTSITFTLFRGNITQFRNEDDAIRSFNFSSQFMFHYTDIMWLVTNGLSHSALSLRILTIQATSCLYPSEIPFLSDTRYPIYNFRFLYLYACVRSRNKWFFLFLCYFFS